MKNILLAASATVMIASVSEATTYNTFVTADPYRATPATSGLQTRAVVLSTSGPQNFSGDTYSFDLNAIGDSVSMDVFGLVAFDMPIDADDLIPRPSSATFDFGSFGTRTIAGVSYAVTAFSTPTTFGSAFVDYFGPTSFNVGGGLRILVDLADTVFGTDGLGNLVTGRPGVGFVNATFTLAAVPLPATLPLGLAGLGLMGFVARRRKKTRA